MSSDQDLKGFMSSKKDIIVFILLMVPYHILKYTFHVMLCKMILQNKCNNNKYVQKHHGTYQSCCIHGHYNRLLLIAREENVSGVYSNYNPQTFCCTKHFPFFSAQWNLNSLLTNI